MDVLSKLSGVIESRKGADPKSSYVASLHDRGIDALVAKVAEEASELAHAAKDGNRHNIVHESADLWFHNLVLLSHFNLTETEVLEELERRFGVSGLEEKAARGKPDGA